MVLGGARSVDSIYLIYFCPSFASFPSLHIVEAVMPPVALLGCSATDSNYFWSVETCHRYCSEFLVGKGRYHNINNINKHKLPQKVTPVTAAK